MPETPPPGLPGDARSLPAGPPVVPLLPAIRRTPRGRPLPDAVAMRRIEIPDSAPPYDDDAGRRPSRRRPAPARVTAARPRAAVTRVARRGRQALPDRPDRRGRPDRSRRPGHRPAARSHPPARSQPGPAAGGTDQWPGQLAQVLVETLAGARPERQVTRWTTEQARRRIRQLGPLLSAGYQPRVHRIIASAPAANVVEMAVIVGVGPRIRAVALRLERSRRTDTWGVRGPGLPGQAVQWLCTAIECAWPASAPRWLALPRVAVAELELAARAARAGAFRPTLE